MKQFSTSPVFIETVIETGVAFGRTPDGDKVYIPAVISHELGFEVNDIIELVVIPNSGSDHFGDTPLRGVGIVANVNEVDVPVTVKRIDHELDRMTSHLMGTLHRVVTACAVDMANDYLLENGHAIENGVRHKRYTNLVKRCAERGEIYSVKIAHGGLQKPSAVFFTNRRDDLVKICKEYMK